MSHTACSSTTCVLQLTKQPTNWWAALVAGGGVALLAGFAVAGIMVLALMVASVIAATTSPRFRAQIAAREERRQLRRRSDARMLRLCAAGTACDRLRRLTTLVDGVRRTHPEELARFEVEDLLDAYTTTAIAHRRCVSLLASNELASILAGLQRLPENRPGNRRAVLQRRLDTWLACRNRAEELNDQLGAIEELIRLIAQRAAFPEVSPLLQPAEIEERIALLANEDTAAAELAGRDAA
jgi:hypothetical protein